MSFHDELGTRMKTYYESVPKTKLMRRTPVIIRLDGKAFHSFTKGFAKPFDKILMESMQETMKYLCENIQGCVFGYTQSDEITLILVDYQTFETQAWFDYEVQKMCSISASMATMKFNQIFNELVYLRCESDNRGNILDKDYIPIHQAHIRATNKGAMFDARVFNIPKEEVTNLVYWRQLDAIRNSVQMVGQANFPHKQLQGKSCEQIKTMLVEEKDINWNELSLSKQRGSSCIKQSKVVNGIERSEWIIDYNIPIFKGEDREYIDKLINVGV
jgi:tRNA(His) 5'-end guanylyltransferase